MYIFCYSRLAYITNIFCNWQVMNSQSTIQITLEMNSSMFKSHMPVNLYIMGRENLQKKNIYKKVYGKMFCGNCKYL